MKPRDARTDKQTLSLGRDNYAVKEGYIILHDGGVVTITTQLMGESPTGSVTLSRRGFNALIDWYNRDQEAPDATD